MPAEARIRDCFPIYSRISRLFTRRLAMSFQRWISFDFVEASKQIIHWLQTFETLYLNKW